MQKHFLTLVATAFVAIFLFSSCSKSNKQGRYIPSDAAMVMHIDGKSMTNKLPWDEVKQNEMFKQANADSSVPAFAKAIMDNPENSGVDVKNDMMIFLVKDTSGGYFAVEGFLKDEAKFKKFLLEANKEAKESSKDGYTYLSDGRNKVMIAFNKDKFILTADAPALASMNATYSGEYGTNTPKKMRDLAATAANLFNLKEDQSLGKNEKFGDLMSTNGDAHFWYNAQSFMKGMDMGPMSAMANVSKVTDGAIFTGTVNFDDGKISFDGKSYMSKDMSDLYKKYSGGDFDKSMVKNIPSANLAGMFILNFKPEGIKEFLRLIGMDGLANMGLYKSGFTLDELVKASKGDLLFAATDITQDSVRGMNASYYAAVSVGDKASFDKILAAGKKLMYGDMMSGDSVSSKYSFKGNEKYVVFTNNEANTAKYLAGNANTSFPFLDKISGGPMGGYVNFQYIFSSIRSTAARDSFQMAALDASAKMWDNLMISGGNYKDGGITQHWEVNLVDKSMNSLKQLNRYAGTMGVIEERRRKSREAMWPESTIAPSFDTTTVAVPAMPGR